ncbi:MAG: cache domain-containing protein, partial [Tuberibacillus sp.]
MSHVKGFKIHSIKTKITLLSLMILIVPSLIIGLSSWGIAKSHLGTQGKNKLKSDVKIVNHTIEQYDKLVKAGAMSKADAQEQVKQLILGPKDSQGHRRINKVFDLGENGYLYIIDTKGIEVAHPSLEGQDISNTKSSDGVMIAKDTIQKAREGGGFISYKWPLPNSKKEAEKITYSEMDPAGWGWVVIAGTYMSDFNSSANTILTYLSVILILAIIIGGILVVVITNRIANPIIEIERTVARVSEGDLTGDLIKVKSSDETGRLADSFNNMTEKLVSIITGISATAEHVAASSEELSSSAEESAKATEQVTITIQEAADGAQKQTSVFEESKQAIIDMTDGIGHIAKNANIVSDSAEQALDK